MRGKVALVVLAIAVGCAGDAAIAGGQPFAPGSYVNKPLAPNAAIDPASATMVQEVLLQVREGELGHAPPWINTTSYGIPVYTVGPTQPTVRVGISGPASSDATLAQQFAAVPIPQNAQPASGADHNLTVYQPSTDKLWDFIGLSNSGGHFTAGYGGEIAPAAPGMLGVAENPGFFMNPIAGFGSSYGASATGIPLLAGLQRIRELQAGAINHVVAFELPAPAPCFRWPAQREDTLRLGSYVNPATSDPLAPPEGAILRLPPTLNIDALHLPPYTAMLAKAVQSYGMVLRDRSGSVAFEAETPQNGDPYGGPSGIFGGRSPAQLAEAFPWDKLQVLAAPRGKSACSY